MKPVVSIIMPAFNATRTIGQAIESAQAQTFKQWEMLVVDDFSGDDTCMIVERYAVLDKRIRLLRQGVNCGPACARNAGINAAVGRYIAFLDSDDCWLPEKLNRQLAFMMANEVSFSYTLYRRFTDNVDRPGPLLSLPSSFTYSQLLKNTGIGCLTAMIDRKLSGPIEFSGVRHEDYVLWLSILKRGFVAQGLMEDLGRYRISKSSISGNKLKSASWVWNIYRDVEKLNMVYAVWCFLNYAWNACRKNR